MRSELEIIENAQSEWLEYLALQEENQSKNVVPQRVRAEEPINEEPGMRLEAGYTTICISAEKSTKY